MRVAWLLLLGLALSWYTALALLFPSAGAIGNDPATYVQMALDLARRGTPTHEFPLLYRRIGDASLLAAQGLSWDAFISPGYRIVPETGAIAPIFAFGFPLLMVPAYHAFGEGALYAMTPLLGALALLATFALGNELLHDLSPQRRRTISALAVLLLATTPKQITHVLVPLSDVPTQLAVVLTLWCALRVQRVGASRWDIPTVLWAALCGLGLGYAYLIRHSALIALAPLGFIARKWGTTARRRIGLMALALAICSATILPDVFYRARVLGSPLAVESPESAELVFWRAPQQLVEMLLALVSLTGFGPLALLIPVGWWVLWRESRRETAWILGIWVLGYMLFHAPLRLTGVFENNLRYLLPAFPALTISIGLAVVWFAEHVVNVLRAWRVGMQGDCPCTLLGRVWMRRGAYGHNGKGAIELCPCAPISIASAVVLLLALGIAVRALGNPHRFVARAYGWMSATARRDLEALNAQLPPQAVVGTSDQMAGAVLLYTRRDIFRPGSFIAGEQEFARFMELMRAEGRPVFVLGDWNCAETANASERLPEWMGRETGWKLERDWRPVIRDLPYACAQRLIRLE